MGHFKVGLPSSGAVVVKYFGQGHVAVSDGESLGLIRGIHVWQKVHSVAESGFDVRRHVSLPFPDRIAVVVTVGADDAVGVVHLAGVTPAHHDVAQVFILDEGCRSAVGQPGQRLQGDRRIGRIFAAEQLHDVDGPGHGPEFGQIGVTPDNHRHRVFVHRSWIRCDWRRRSCGWIDIRIAEPRRNLNNLVSPSTVFHFTQIFPTVSRRIPLNHIVEFARAFGFAGWSTEYRGQAVQQIHCVLLISVPGMIGRILHFVPCSKRQDSLKIAALNSISKIGLLSNDLRGRRSYSFSTRPLV